MSFSPNSEVSESQKTLDIWKTGKYDEEIVFLKKKVFGFDKSLLCKNGKAKNMPLVAGRLVKIAF